MAKAFPDLNKDGKVTRADVLMGRGVDLESKAEGSLMVSPERQKRSMGSLIGKLVTKAVITPELKSNATKAGKAFDEAGPDDFLDKAVDKIEANEKILKEDFGVTNNQLKAIAYNAGDIVSYADTSEAVIKLVELQGTNDAILDLMKPMRFRRFKMIHGSKFETEKELNKFYQDYLKLFETGKDNQLRAKKQKGGSMMVPPEMEMPVEEPPVDTYDNISPEEEMQQAEDMLPDDKMEEEYVDYVAEEVLEPEEQEYLFKVLDEDPRLEGILDKIILNATEFAGEGEVEGPGTGISDSIPARLSDGEFVITKKATDQIGADNLQKMMDDAERAYDGGPMGMAKGGEAGTNPFVNPEEIYGIEKDGEEDIERQMLYSSRMPSLMNR